MARSKRKRTCPKVSQKGEQLDKKVKKLIEDPDAQWVIEKLLRKEVLDDGTEGYWVRWEGFSEDWDTWEPRSELMKNCTGLIARFEQIEDPASQHKVYCICKKPYRVEDGAMLQCVYCYNWYHLTCLDISVVKLNQFQKFYCQDCEKINPCAKTKYKDNSEMKPEPFYDDLPTFYGHHVRFNSL